MSIIYHVLFDYKKMTWHFT